VAAVSALTVTFERVDKAAVHAEPIGDGSLEVRSDGVRMRGRVGRRRLLAAIAVATALLGYVATVVGLMALDLDSWLDGKGVLVFFVLGGFLPAFVLHAALQPRLRGAPFDVLVPWARLTVVGSGHGLIHLRIATDAIAGDINVRVPDESRLASVVASLTHRPS
jgi:hypothetical protein